MAEQNIAKKVSKYKLVFVGDQSVGKTSIINRFIYDSFTGSQQPTVGIDFVSKALHLDNRTIRLQLWDTAGQERFRSLIPSYIRDSNTAIITYDITNEASFQSVEKWLDYVREERGEDVLIVLVGNKTDMEDKRQVSKEEAEKFSQQQGTQWYEVSALEGTNITNVFKNIAQTLQQGENKSNDADYKVEPAEKSQAVQLTTTPQKEENKQSGGQCQQC